jgi:hypothetical protein
VTIAANAPTVATSQVITPTGGAAIIGSAPSVIVNSLVKTPGVVNLSLVGAAPGIAQSRVITPARGQLTLVGGVSVVVNPNWIPVNDAQTPGWSDINDSQTPNWVAIAA